MKYKVAVVGGAGHIGLPLSCYIQNAGIDTSIIDTNEENIDKINSFTPFLAKFLAWSTSFSIGVDRCLPRINGIAQKEHGLSQPSAIFSYA